MISGNLIKKYSLSKEDIDDIRSEIEISRLEYGYDRNVEHIIIDYVSKFRNFKRIGEGGKRICVMPIAEIRTKSENGSTTESESYFTDRSSAEKFERSENEFNQSEIKLEIFKNLSSKGRYAQFILQKITEGFTNTEIAKMLNLSESRVSQLIRQKSEKAELLSFLKIKTNLSDLCRVIKWIYQRQKQMLLNI